MKIAAQDAPRPRHFRAAEPAILFTVSRQFFAIAAHAVQEIRSTDSIAGAASEFGCPEVPKVRHTFERARRQYYVVNACAHFGLRATRPTLVLILRQLRVAVLVDRIERMTELPSVYDLPLGFSGEERRWYRGLTYIEDHVIPVVDPRGFLTPEEFRQIEGVPAPLSSSQELEGASK
ncbi:MAG TPA: chemotaxis protein CheW [Candidatus Acidoferrales bacterium]|nr:chemotaxis protein CheW [Candidatus Acidoferrales bacterium]